MKTDIEILTRVVMFRTLTEKYFLRWHRCKRLGDKIGEAFWAKMHKSALAEKREAGDEVLLMSFCVPPAHISDFAI